MTSERNSSFNKDWSGITFHH